MFQTETLPGRKQAKISSTLNRTGFYEMNTALTSAFVENYTMHSYISCVV